VSCKTDNRLFHHLGVESKIDVLVDGKFAGIRRALRKGCELRWGQTASHRVKVENSSLVEVEVELKCECAVDAALLYRDHGPCWNPPPRELKSGDSPLSRSTFAATLDTAVGGAGTKSEQVTLIIRRRRLYTGAWSRCAVEPLRAIAIS
jgi:hypothetical protein